MISLNFFLVRPWLASKQARTFIFFTPKAVFHLRLYIKRPLYQDLQGRGLAQQNRGVFLSKLSVNIVCKCCNAKHLKMLFFKLSKELGARENLLPADPGHFHAQYTGIALLL